jgi:hypothetical protein
VVTAGAVSDTERGDGNARIEKRRGAIPPTQRAAAFVLEHNPFKWRVAVDAGYAASGALCS